MPTHCMLDYLSVTETSNTAAIMNITSSTLEIDANRATLQTLYFNMPPPL